MNTAVLCATCEHGINVDEQIYLCLKKQRTDFPAVRVTQGLTATRKTNCNKYQEALKPPLKHPAREEELFPEAGTFDAMRFLKNEAKKAERK